MDRYVIRGIAPHKVQSVNASYVRARLLDYQGRYPRARIIRVSSR